MATLSTVITFARAVAQTDSNGLTDANAIIYANEALLDYHRQLIEAGVDASQVQEAYRDATLNQPTYLYPSDLFFLKGIEVNLISSNQQDYQTAQQVDVSNLPFGQSFDFLRVNQPAMSPLFDDHGDYFEIFPTPTTGMNLTAAIKVIYFLTPTEYTSTSDTISYPESLDYRVIGWRIAADYYYSLGKMDEGDRYMELYQKRVDQLKNTLERGSEQPLQAKGLGLTGWEF